MTAQWRYPLQLRSEMQATDAFFWFAEAAAPRLRPLVAGLFMLDQRPDPKHFRASIERLVERVPRLRQRVDESPWRLGLPRWQDDGDFDLDYHLRTVVLPQPGNDRHMLDFASALFATPLDHLRPLWEGYLIAGMHGGRSAYFLKMHHSVMDGAGAVALFDAMTERRRNQVAEPPHAHHRPTPLPNGNGSGLLWSGLRNAASSVGDIAAALGQTLSEPRAAVDGLVRNAAAVRRIIGELSTPLPDDPLSLRCTGVGRRLSTVNFSLARLQRLRGVIGVTLNDLVLTAVAGAVGRYHQFRGLHLEEVPCIVPVNLRRDHERHELGNRVTAVNVLLPVNQSDPLLRLERIRAQTAAVRANRHGAGYSVFLEAIPLIPSALLRAIARTASGRVHLICSNVQGPSVRRYLAGARVESVHAFAPIMLGIPLSLAFLSYADTVGVGIDADPAAIPDPERIAEFLEAEVEAIERSVVPTRLPAPARRRQLPRARPHASRLSA